MKKKTILLFSTEAGVAHVTRTLAVGTELKHRGHRVIFAITKSKHAMVRASGLEAVDASVILSDRSVGAEAFHNWFDSSFLARYAQSDRSIIQGINPDCLLIDLRVSAVIAGLSLKIPMAFLSGSGALPGVCYLPVMGNPHIFNSVRPVVTWMIDRAKKQQLVAVFRAVKMLGVSMNARESLRSLVYIVPEAPWYLPYPRKDLTIHYVGPIFWQGFESETPEWLGEMKPNGKTIYVSFGGTGYDKQKLVTLCKELVSRGFRVIVSASNIVSINEFPKDKNLFVAKYVPGFAVSGIADLVLCHGGYGTMMQAVISGKPVVAVPYNFDQVLHGYRFAELGLATCVTELRMGQIIKQRWDTLFHMGRFVSVSKILNGVNEAFENKTRYQDAITQFQRKLGNINGAQEAANVVERL